MPKIIGKSKIVVDFEGLTIDELSGNVATNEESVSIARVTVSKPTAEPWLTVAYDEYICVTKGYLEMHTMSTTTNEDGTTASTSGTDVDVLTVKAGETCLVSKGERFRPVFPEGGVEYIPVCFPAFKPELCIREEEGVSEVSTKLRHLHTAAAGDNNKNNKNINTSSAPPTPEEFEDHLYHMCEKSAWEKAVADGEAYFPPTFEEDNNFTHATAISARLIETANHFYTSSTDEWVCLELSKSTLQKKAGIVTTFENPKPVGDQDIDIAWETSEWRCPHIYGGIPTQIEGIVTKIYPMKRNEQGKFLSIEGLTNDDGGTAVSGQKKVGV